MFKNQRKWKQARKLLSANEITSIYSYHRYKDVYSRQLQRLFFKSDKLNDFVEPLTNLPTYPLLLLWTLIALAEFSFLTLSLLAAAGLAMMIPMGVIAYIGINQKQVKIRSKVIDNIVLQKAKLFAMTACLEDVDVNENTFTQYLLMTNDEAWNSQKKYTLEHLRTCFDTGCSVQGTLFGTYYLGLVAVAKVFGAVSVTTALMTPTGLLVALAICTALGVIFAWNQYNCIREDQYCKKLVKVLQKETEALHQTFDKAYNEKFNLKSTTFKRSKLNRLRDETAKIYEPKVKPASKSNVLRQQGFFGYDSRVPKKKLSLSHRRQKHPEIEPILTPHS